MLYEFGKYKVPDNNNGHMTVISGASKSFKHWGVQQSHKNIAKSWWKTGEQHNINFYLANEEKQAKKNKERRKSGGQNGALGLDGIILTDELKKVTFII